ncbi:pentatricopeptide repeat-containing protein At2g39620 [Mercurialis annua]|uniref:pentatricopeptide repeat-containing protein At2g39620 n=1 Tax=Mercurialis annua TaxID=3986 RepID=UPI00215F7FDC|nr:pentatricopeptide repeat-containing protein At2g39620 [Mercurialis annua]XP_050208986.1 pentatricopeptide repeat-containing protein At2g39620 [Mercurialis annua]XP_050208987.1 pentatricopeptide repeat-containing protein At2g39620 [Mercurialis annua]
MGKHALTIQRFFHAQTSINKSPIPIQKNSNYLQILSSCKNLHSTLQIHAHLIISGHQNHHLTNTHLIKCYISLKRHELARLVFDLMPNPTLRLYNSMIQAYANAKNHKEAIKMYHLMLDKGLEPDKYTFNFVLKACSGGLEFKEGILIHREIGFKGLDCDVYVGTALVDMYGKMGDVGMARNVFDKMPDRDVVTWNAMVLGLARSGEPEEALELVGCMGLGGVEADLVTVLNLVLAVSRLGDVDACRTIHGYVTRKGFDGTVSNGLIDMYCKCGDVGVACQVFERMRDRNDVSWKTMMAGYAHNECFFEVLELFDRMKRENVALNKVSVATALLAAAEMRDLRRGEEICHFARNQGMESDVSMTTAVMTMYAKCGYLDDAKRLFHWLKEKDLVAWSAIISAVVQSGYPEDALSLFRDMQHAFLKANNITLLSVLTACAELMSLPLGKSVHCYAVKASFDSDIPVGTALMSMYAKCGLFTYALTVFNRMPCKDIVTCNTLIYEYAQNGYPYPAMEMFHRVQTSEIRPDSGTMIGLLSVSVLLNDLDQGISIHGQIVKSGFDSLCKVKNALIDMYGKCGSLSDAKFLFCSTEFIKDEVSWNVLIAGYVHNGHAKDAISLFHQMKSEHFEPNLVTFVSIFPAVAYLSALNEGIALHALVIRMGFESNIPVRNCLLDMYAKCGQLHYSEQLFHEMNYKNTVSWNVMLAGYAVNGQGNRAVELFSLMQKNNVKVDSLSFIGVLSACRHAGLIDEGRKIFDIMCKKHDLEPGLEHYACMVDLLGRAGLFDEISHLIEGMTLEPDAGVWGALLGACKIHSNVHLAESAVDHLVKLEPENPTHLVVLSNIYAKSGRWRDADSTRSNMFRAGLKKSPGWSWV